MTRRKRELNGSIEVYEKLKDYRGSRERLWLSKRDPEIFSVV